MQTHIDENGNEMIWVLNNAHCNNCGSQDLPCDCGGYELLSEVRNIRPLGLPDWETHFGPDSVVNNQDDEAEQEEVRVHNRTDINGRPCLGLPGWNDLMAGEPPKKQRVNNRRRGIRHGQGATGSRAAHQGCVGVPHSPVQPLGTPSLID
jgi:hypothetical protein